MTDIYMRAAQEARERGQLEGRIARAEQERDIAIRQRDIAIAEKNKAQEDNQKLKEVIRADRTYFMGEIRKANQRRIQSVAWPLTVAGICVILFILAEIGVSTDLVSVLVGEPIAYIALCALFYCVGMIVDRLTKKKAAGGKHHGND